MNNIKLGLRGHDVNLIHYVPTKWEKRWIKSTRWCKLIDRDWIYAAIVGCLVFGAIIIVELLGGGK